MNLLSFAIAGASGELEKYLAAPADVHKRMDNAANKIMDETLEMMKTNKTRNIAKEYYNQTVKAKTSASVDFETFKDSWAGKLWIKQNRQKITEIFDREHKRFNGWSHEVILGI